MEKKPDIKCEVERSFFMNGEPTEVGKTYDLEFNFAHQMKAANKVKFVTQKSKKKTDPVDPVEPEKKEKDK
jgi:hypothetical protein